MISPPFSQNRPLEHLNLRQGPAHRPSGGVDYVDKMKPAPWSTVVGTFSLLMVLLCLGPVCSLGLAEGKNQDVLYLDLDQRTLKEVVEDIRQQTGYRVSFNKRWDDLPISGTYQAVTLESFFHSALRHWNKAITVNEQERTAVLVLLQKKESPVNQPETMVAADGDVPYRQEDLDAPHRDGYLKIYQHLATSAVQKMHLAQQQQLEKIRNDPNATDPRGTLSNREIQKLHDLQASERERLRQYPAGSLPHSSG
jgi:hypothetical protein